MKLPFLKDGWKHRNHQNLKFLWYEDIISDLPKIIEEIATFTDKEVFEYDFILHNYLLFLVENISKGSLDLIQSPSPSMKSQIKGGKVGLRCKGKTLLRDVNKLLKTKSLLTTFSLKMKVIGLN